MTSNLDVLRWSRRVELHYRRYAFHPACRPGPTSLKSWRAWLSGRACVNPLLGSDFRSRRSRSALTPRAYVATPSNWQTHPTPLTFSESSNFLCRDPLAAYARILRRRDPSPWALPSTFRQTCMGTSKENHPKHPRPSNLNASIGCLRGHPVRHRPAQTWQSCVIRALRETSW